MNGRRWTARLIVHATFDLLAWASLSVVLWLVLNLIGRLGGWLAVAVFGGVVLFVSERIVEAWEAGRIIGRDTERLDALMDATDDPGDDWDARVDDALTAGHEPEDGVPAR